ncbi:B-cell receptor CD22-like isoform X2 [Myxocyprinus asiaticus]|uniref:B-cell receptor CD22-like isoform X2 n=1 Tax=Myxocyprinus asiaticus TaxID=70543 RepID=UPI0022214028|nr:B-cell receptor CD22-like isoform X2 [Myxocyprinus asiaticus]
MFRLSSLIFLLVIPGICGQTWNVKYKNLNICALKGSTTLLSGSYTHPNGLTVTKTFWTTNPDKGDDAPDLFDDPHYKGRTVYSLSKAQTFYLKLSNVTDKDERIYCLNILTNVENDSWMGFPCVYLQVTDLRVEIPQEVIERNSALLFCETSCNLGNSANYNWYKNSKPFSGSLSTNELLLQSVSSDDTGNYSCAVTQHEHLPSPAVTLSVRYPPKKVSVSISGSGEIVLFDSVTLTCSSDSNPPVLNYTWFKENETSSVGSGQSYSISNFNSSHSGQFYCVAQNEHGSQRSAAVSVTVAGKTPVLTVVISAAFLAFMVLMVAIALLIRRKRVSPSEEQNNRGLQHNEKIESPEGNYMTLDPMSRCSDYDTVHNVKRSCSNTDDTESQDPTYYNINN